MSQLTLTSRPGLDTPPGWGLALGSSQGTQCFHQQCPSSPLHSEQTPSTQGPGPALNLGRGGEEEMVDRASWVSEASGMLSTLSSRRRLRSGDSASSFCPWGS